jgi:hypothetical protein
MISLAPRYHYPVRKPLVIGDHVYGMALSDTSMLRPPRLTAPIGRPQIQRVIKLSAAQAERLYDFFTQAYAYPVPIAFNCHTFTRRLMGIGRFESGLSHTCLPGYAVEPTALDSLEPGQPYGFVQARGHLAHSVIALNDPSQSLSVLGRAQPIVIADTRRFNFIYYGRSIHRILPETIDATRLRGEQRTRYGRHGRHFTPAQQHDREGLPRST